MYFYVYLYPVILTININLAISRIFSFKIFLKNMRCLVLQNFKKYLICAWKLLPHKGYYALKIGGGRQTERQKDIEAFRTKTGKTTW